MFTGGVSYVRVAATAAYKVSVILTVVLFESPGQPFFELTLLVENLWFNLLVVSVFNLVKILEFCC